jgi:hypothetical protein
MTEQTEDDLLGDGIFTAEDKNRYNLRSKSNAAQQMHQPLLKRLLPLLSKKIIHQKISQQSLQRRKHQLLPRRLLPLSSIKLQKVSLLLNNKESGSPFKSGKNF